MHGLRAAATSIVLAAMIAAIAPIAAADALRLEPGEADRIGLRIWQNEGRGEVSNLTVWNLGEDFPSFGIGHFIWYPAGVDGPFEETFPDLLAVLARTVTLPAWLAEARDAPWQSRVEFYDQFDSRGMIELRRLLEDTIPQQADFLVARLDAALPKMLASIEDPMLRDHVERQFRRVAREPNGPYVLVDYVNFKGEGISPDERYRGEGWGLLQVLEEMRGDRDAITEFVRAADVVLTRRVRNADRDESRWLSGWRSRLQTYLAVFQ